MKRYTDMTASYFQSLGIGHGDMVMLILKRRYEFWFSIIALHKLGAVVIPATHLLTQKDIIYRCNAADIKMIVCAGESVITDHITAAIGGAISASSGADFLCYVTPAEHLRLPNANDVREGLVATKIAAHAADIAKGVPGARDRDNRMSDARRRVAWDEMFDLSLDPARARAVFESAPPSTEGTCTMCGKMCAVRTVNKVFEGTTIDLGMED